MSKLFCLLKWAKFVGLLKISAKIAPVLLIIDYLTDVFVRDSIFGDSKYIVVLCGAIVVDAVVGLAYHYTNKSLDPEQFLIGFAKKIGITFSVMLLVSALTSAKEWETISLVRDYLILTTKLFCSIYVIGSGLKNLHYLSGEKIPPKSFMDRLAKFNETGKVEDLKAE